VKKRDRAVLIVFVAAFVMVLISFCIQSHKKYYQSQNSPTMTEIP